MPVSEELQVTAVVSSAVLPSEKVPVAVNCWGKPAATLGLAGVTSSDWSTAAGTVKGVQPGAPVGGAAVGGWAGGAAAGEGRGRGVGGWWGGVGMAVSEELRVTAVVSSAVLPSEKVPVAVNCWVKPAATLGLAGVTSSDWSTAAVTVKVVEPVTPLRVAAMVV